MCHPKLHLLKKDSCDHHKGQLSMKYCKRDNASVGKKDKPETKANGRIAKGNGKITIACNAKGSQYDSQKYKQ